MANGRGSLHARLNAIEDRLISDIDRRIANLSDFDRRSYENWRTDCEEQYRNFETEPGKYFEAYLNGEAASVIPYNVKLKLWGNMYFSKTITIEEIKDEWNDCL